MSDVTARPSAARWRGALEVVLVAAWSALLTALVHVGTVGVEAIALERLVFTSRDVVWMAPLSYLVFFLTLAVPLAALAFAAPPRGRTWVVRAATFGFVAL